MEEICSQVDLAMEDHTRDTEARDENIRKALNASNAAQETSKELSSEFVSTYNVASALTVTLLLQQACISARVSEHESSVDVKLNGTAV